MWKLEHGIYYHYNTLCAINILYNNTIIIISLQMYTYCTCYFGEDYLVVKTWTPGQYDI